MDAGDEDEPEDGFATTVNVILEPSLAPAVTPEVYFDASFRILRNPDALRGEAGRVIQRLDPRDFGTPRRFELDGEDAYRLEYSGNQSGRAMRFRAVATVHDGTGYAVTYTALRTRFDEDVDGFDAVLDTWRWR